MWNVKAKVIPVITGATSTISKALRQYLSNIQESMKLRNYNKCHSGHCTHTTECTNVVQNIFHGRNNTTCSTDCKNRTAATLYTLQTWFISGVKL